MQFRRARQIQTRASRRSTRASHRLDPPVAARPAAVTRGLPVSHPCWHHRPPTARLYHLRCQRSLRPGRSLRCSATTGGRRHAYARSRLRRAGRWWWTGRERAPARAKVVRAPCSGGGNRNSCSAGTPTKGREGREVLLLAFRLNNFRPPQRNGGAGPHVPL